MVENIEVGILNGMDVDDPIKDAAFMARIGAKQRTIGAFEKTENGTSYELTNVENGTKFPFGWFPKVGLCSYK